MSSDLSKEVVVSMLDRLVTSFPVYDIS
jgi:hypothetical protein